MYNSFPFNIGDVARLCGIIVNGPKGNSEYVECPFCGRKKKLNLNYKKNQFRCAACGKGGSMLNLYSTLTGFSGSNGEITKHIKEELGIVDNYKYNYSHTVTFCRDNQSNTSDEEETLEIDLEKMQKYDKAYRAFLDKLFLADMHRKKLMLDRELSENDIIKYGFKSVPIFGYKRICKELINEGVKLSGVGGFYYDIDGWNININPKMTGYIIPTYNIYGLIEGLQIRLDRPFGKTKYLWISSDGLNKGSKTAAIPYYVKGCRRNDTLIITEGAFKAIIPNKVFGYHIMALPGVNNQKEFLRIIPAIKQAGYKNIIEAFDADFRVNEDVAKAKEELKKLIIESGLNYSKFEWELKDGKGLDDYALTYLRTHM